MKLATSRLVLREAQPDDTTALAAYHRIPRYLEHYARPPDSARIVEQAIEWAAQSPRLNFQFIVALADGAPIGCAGLRQSGYNGCEAEIGIELDPEYWGSGYAREAVSALLSFATEELRLSALMATAAANRRVHRLLVGLGFTPCAADHEEVQFRLLLPSP